MCRCRSVFLVEGARWEIALIENFHTLCFQVWGVIGVKAVLFPA